MTRKEIMKPVAETSRGAFESITAYLNIAQQPDPATVKREALLSGAWAATGRHLRKALKEYGQGSDKKTDGQ